MSTNSRFQDERISNMSLPSSPAEMSNLSQTHKLQRRLLTICILLAPLSFSVYAISWTQSLRQPLIASAQAGSTGNLLHFIAGVLASFFLPLGYLGMSLLGMRLSPRLATLCAALALIGWIPWSALIGLDDLANLINLTVSTPEKVALWVQFNSDPVMTIYLLIYIIGHLLSAVLIAYMLGHLRIIPSWTAWAFALSSLLSIIIFPIHILFVQNMIKYLICIFLFAGAIPAAIAMLKDKDLQMKSPSPA